MRKDEEKEHVVAAPKGPLPSPIDGELEAGHRIMREERKEILRIAKRIGPLFSGLALISGLTLMIVVAYFSWTGQIMEFLEVRLVVVTALIIIGIVNIISGLLIMGRAELKS